MLKSKGGFTLIELVMIIIILGILAAVAIPKYYDLTEDARESSIKAGLGGIKSAWGISYGRYKAAPTLASLVAAVDGATIDGVVGLYIADIFRKDGTTTYKYKTYISEDCSTTPTSATTSSVSCIKCEFAGCNQE